MHVWGRGEVYKGFWWGNLRERGHLGVLGVDGSMRWLAMDWIDLAQDRARVSGTCKCGNEPSGSMKCGEFLD